MDGFAVNQLEGLPTQVAAATVERRGKLIAVCGGAYYGYEVNYLRTSVPFAL